MGFFSSGNGNEVIRSHGKRQEQRDRPTRTKKRPKRKKK